MAQLGPSPFPTEIRKGQTCLAECQRKCQTPCSTFFFHRLLAIWSIGSINYEPMMRA